MGSGESGASRAATRVAAIVLAAGRSTRMGPQNKLLADISGKPMVRRVVEAVLASKARPVLVVTGHMAADVAAAVGGDWASQIEQGERRRVPSPLVGEGQGGGDSERGSDPSHPKYRVFRDGVREGSDPRRGVPPTPSPSPIGGGESRRDSTLDVMLVSNPDYATGLASSLKAGIRAVPADCDGALILLGDMPRIAAEDVSRLIEAFVAAPDTIVVPTHEGKRGNPVLWPRRYFPALLQLEGDAGAKRLIAALREHVQEVPMGTSAIFADVDTPDELRRLLHGHPG